jgi:predicted lipid-binding transport protein (Tim44 family)
MAIRRHFGLALLVGSMLVWATAARVEARPGGGQGYSGAKGRSGGSSSQSSATESADDSSSRDSQIRGPEGLMLGIALLLVVVGTAIGVIKAREKYQEWKTGSSRGAFDTPSARQGGASTSATRGRADGPQWRAPKNAFALVRDADPEFSAVLFDDFVYGLYAAAHRARHDADALATLSPYLGDAVRQSLQARPPVGVPVRSVVVGAMRVLGARANPPDPANRAHEVKIEVESNVATAAEGTASESATYLKEVWILARRADARTRPWKGARTFGCPACGAPVTEVAGGRCRACGQTIENGRFDWQVVSAEVLASEPRPPALTAEVEERGTDLPTAISPTLADDWGALAAADPAVTDPAIAERTSEIFSSLHSAWSEQDLRTVRPYVSDTLLQYLQYWVDAYRGQGLRNAVERARITRLETAKVIRDLHYDAVTLRVFASGFEVTTDAATGKLVAGSRRRERAYSEYWTLIRGAEVRGRHARAQVCPGCGAALAITMAGTCEYCGVHVTAGEFDWVLSRIEQDDSYSG